MFITGVSDSTARYFNEKISINLNAFIQANSNISSPLMEVENENKKELRLKTRALLL